MLMEHQTVTNTAVIHGLCAMSDIKSAMHPLLAQARPRMINHLTSVKSHPEFIFSMCGIRVLTVPGGALYLHFL